ncbi:MAG TPA: response regulator [Gemmatimonadales bacterium]
MARPSGDWAAASAELDAGPGIGTAVAKGLLDHLLVGERTSQLVHLTLIGVVWLLLWGNAPRPELSVWVGGVVTAVVTRMTLLRAVTRRDLAPDVIIRALRLGVTAVALAWGVGGAAIAPTLSLPFLSLILLPLCGMVAGGANSLAADRRSFLQLVICMLGPMVVGILAHGMDRTHGVAALLVVIFGGAMTLVNWRGHRTLVDYLSSAARLRVSEQDATRRRANLESLVRSAPIAIAVVTADGIVEEINPAFEALFGFAAADVVGRRIDDNIVGAGDRVVSQNLAAAARRGETVTVEVERLHKDGHPIPVHVTAARLESAGGAAGVLALYEDITPQRHAEAAMRQARDAAERSAQARAAFLANMSHEIRTPMNAVLGLVEIVLDSELAPPQRRSLELVRSSAEGLLSLLNDILDFSKIEAEHLDLEQIAFDLPKVVHGTASLLAVRAREKGVELITDVPADVPTLVRGDPTRLRQVLTNLIGNAIKFTERGEVVVRATAGPAGPDGVPVQFEVRDTGIGIPEHQMQQIFSEFTQADASMTRRYGGTGLGLAIAKRLVLLMGSDLTVTSIVGQGSRFAFRVTFPVDVEPPPAVARAPLHGTRVLVVDDNQTNRRILEAMLAPEGVVVEGVESAAEGLAALREARTAGKAFALALIDAQMPDRDGFALAADVRGDAHLSGTHLMMLTSAGERGDSQRCRELGIRGYLTKPVARVDLLDAIAAIFGGAAAGTEVVTRHTLAEARRHLRILLAEDTPVNQEVASTMLRRRGHVVDVVANGREAVAAAARARYDVVLMDVQMPEMDGFEATAAIRATPAGRALPIVALTAHALTGERERCLSHGMTGYLAKPYRPHDLFAAVEGWGTEPPPAPLPEPGGAAHLDLDDLTGALREAGAEDALAGILDAFSRTVPQRIAALSDALAAGDPQEVSRAAHAFKSGAVTVRARALSALLQRVELDGQDGRVNDARAREPEIRAEADVVVRELRRVRAEAKTGD